MVPGLFVFPGQMEHFCNMGGEDVPGLDFEIRTKKDRRDAENRWLEMKRWS